MTTTRRQFLQGLAASAAAAPFVMSSRAGAAPSGPNGKVTVGFIGLGTQGRGLLGGFLGQNTRVLAVAEVDTARRESAKQRIDAHYQNKDCTAYVDWRELVARKDIDAVCIATPDHWHALATLAALRAGKDVYCEKPLTHNITEAVEVIKAVDANQRVLQTGSMQRSMKEFRVACELVRNGVIGKIDHVDCSFGGPGRPCDLPTETMEPGLDWDMWIGPGPMRGYNSQLSPRGVHKHFPNWRAYKEYGSGMVGDWGAHHLDIAQWGLGMDDSGPVEVLPAASEKANSGAVLVYASGIKVYHKGGFGVDFVGDRGEVKVNRGAIHVILEGKTVAEFTDAVRKKGETSLGAELKKLEPLLKDAQVKLYESRNHISDFMGCVASRKKPITSEIVGGHSVICCHLLNQSYYHHAHLKWDPAKYQFTDGTGDPSWLVDAYRAPWKL